ncbi:hypothetical protein A2164_00965 [Candidatus Curtissbacteria bacterium RBG_13_35_7]|uniref:Phosphoribosyltransferase domain-containing protein n=1 Tax=Candidatus Curtissbacteria bacterium RBG_13_35_7 TaxID=1797705 RepID=A0A1F5G510_9BACT|nr:MAG: hypothetical protein A2164_00965 [Candidatus Curtissbacteria bacterium RBG_13_35_7]
MKQTVKPQKITFNELITKIPFKEICEFAPEAVVGIERGGAILGAIVASRLDIGMVSILASLYDDKKPANRLYTKPIIRITNSLNHLVGKRVLLVDDVANTGKTLATAKGVLSDKVKSKEIKTFVYAGKADFSCMKFNNCLRFFWEQQK